MMTQDKKTVCVTFWGVGGLVAKKLKAKQSTEKVVRVPDALEEITTPKKSVALVLALVVVDDKKLLLLL